MVLYATEAAAVQELGCLVSNVIRYYLVLVSVAWNGVEAVNMYLSLVRIFDSHVHHFVLKAALVAWGKDG